MRRLLLTIAFLLLFTAPVHAQYWGDYTPLGNVDIDFTTRSLSTGQPTTLSGSPVVQVLKDNGTTYSGVTGITLSTDIAGTTGLNNVHITTSSNSSFFTSGSVYFIVVTTGTVGGTNVAGETFGSFTLGARGVTIAKGVAFNNFYIMMTGPTGQGVPSLTLNCNISKDGGAPQASTNAAAEIGAGLYKINFTATETTANSMYMICTGGSALPFRTMFTPRQ